MTAPYENVLVHVCILLIQHNQDQRAMSPDPFPFLWVGSGDETNNINSALVNSGIL